MKNYRLILFTFFYLVYAIYLQAQQIAFPGAEGFGRFAEGGRGGDVYHVTNLDDDGNGSLRYGIEKMNAPRTIVFDISGTIELKDRIKIKDSYLTIAGQTAPGDGITLGGNSLSIEASHIILRYIRCRYGDISGGQRDAVSINYGKNIIVDHVTASWSVDETFSCQSKDVDSLTVQWCMITESLRYSNHDKGAHGYGGIIGSLNQTFHHNLYAHHSSRNPKITGRRHCEVDFRNNVIYNWGYNSCYDGTSSYINWANNYYKSGPATSDDVRHRIFQLSDGDIESSGSNSPEDSQNYETSLYAEGNYVDGFPEVTADNWNGGIDFYKGAAEAKNRARTPFNFSPITEQTADEAYILVLDSAGASITRDVIDKRIINEVFMGTTTFTGSISGDPGLIDSQDDVGGWPELISKKSQPDADQDGMPDEWELGNGLDPNNHEDMNDDSNFDGYTNLEEYLNSITSDRGITDVEIDNTLPKNYFLSQNYPNPFNPVTKIKYSIPQVENGNFVQLIVFDVLSNEVTTLVDQSQSPGTYEVEFNGSFLSSGIYFYKLKAGNFIQIKKMILLK